MYKSSGITGKPDRESASSLQAIRYHEGRNNRRHKGHQQQVFQAEAVAILVVGRRQGPDHLLERVDALLDTGLLGNIQGRQPVHAPRVL